MRRVILSGLFGFVVVALLIVAAVSLNKSGASNIPPGPHKSAIGLVNLQGGVSEITARSDGQSLTTADVSHYVTTNTFVGGPTVSGAYPNVISIQLVTSQAAGQIVGEGTGLPDGTMVYMVVLHGPFMLTNIHSPVPVHVNPTNNVFEVFVAQTGNLVEWGAHQ